MEDVERDALLHRADLLLDRGAAEEAADLAALVLASDPQDQEALRILGYSALRLQDFERAVEVGEALVQVDPEDPIGYHCLASAHYFSDNDRQALRIAREGLSLAPDSLELLALVVQIAVFVEEDAIALSAAQRLVRLDPHDADHHVALARAYNGAGQYRRSTEALTQALRLDPTHAEAQRLLALDLGTMFDARAIDGALTGAGRADPTSQDLETTVQAVIFRFGLLLVVVSAAVGALVTLATWGAGDDFAPVPAVVAAVLVALALGFFGWSGHRIGWGRLRRGWAAEHWVEHGPGWRFIHRVCITVGLVSLGCWVAAGLAPGAAVRLGALTLGFALTLGVAVWVAWPKDYDGSPEVADVPDHLRPAVALSFWGLDRAARRDLQRLIRQDPDDVTALCELALVEAVLGDPSSAHHLLDHAQDLAPDEFDVHLTRAQVLVEEGRHLPAREAARRAEELDPQDWQVHFNLALTAVALRDGEGARTASARTVELVPTSGHAHFVQGLSHVMDGDNNAAADAFEQAIDLNAHLLAARDDLRTLRRNPTATIDDLAIGPLVTRFSVVASYVLGEILGVVAAGWLIAGLSVLFRGDSVPSLPVAAALGMVQLAIAAWCGAQFASFWGRDSVRAAVGELSHELGTALLAGGIGLGWSGALVACLAPDPTVRWGGVAVGAAGLVVALVARLRR